MRRKIRFVCPRVLNHKNIPLQSVLDYWIIFLFLLFVFIITTTKLFLDDGVFWHLATGRSIIENKAIPSSDIFGFITGGTKWVPFEWGWDVLTYSIWLTGGYPLLSIFRSALVITAFLSFFSLLKKLNISALIYIPLGLLLCFGLLSRLNIRPHLITYMLLSILIVMLIYYKNFSPEKSKLIFVIPFIFVLWCNLHPGVVLGGVVLFCYILSEFLLYWGRKNLFRKCKSIPSKNKLFIIMLAGGLSLAAMMLNPNHIETYIYAFEHTQMERLGNINEWLSPFDGRVTQFYYIKIYLAFLTAGFVILLYSIKTKNTFFLMLYFVFAVYSTQAQRYMADYMVIIFIPLVISVSYFWNEVLLKGSRNSSGMAAVVRPAMKPVSYLKFSALLLTGTALIYLNINTLNNNLYYELNNKFRETGFGINEDYYPVKLFNFIKQERIHETGKRPFNNLRIGGFFLWNFPGKKNFIDSRNLSNEAMQNYFELNLMKNNSEKKLSDYDIDYVIYSVPYMTVAPKEIEQNIIAYLSRSTDWKLIFWDDKSLLFVRNEAKFAELIKKYEYKYLTPINFYFNRKLMIEALNNNREAVEEEIRRKTADDSGGIMYKSMIQNLKSGFNVNQIGK